ncbi:MAG TPA: hypothetical protein VJS11_09965 [Acidobacteriaceae bacterium]|nr:hypothetical protein [Acidobacteriaceae bacterium]
MPPTVNLKKYIATETGWRFVPVLRVGGKPRPETVLIAGEAVRSTAGTFYIEWRENGRRIQKPVGRSPRAALDAWRAEMARLGGGDGDEPVDVPADEVSIEKAAGEFLENVRATKSPATYEAYSGDLRWFQKEIGRITVASVTRRDILRVLGAGREQGRSQATINRAVMVGLMALRQAGRPGQARARRLAEDRRERCRDLRARGDQSLFRCLQVPGAPALRGLPLHRLSASRGGDAAPARR